MSSILKALRKLEEEKTALRRDPLKIDAEILRAPPKARRSSIVILLASVLLCLCGSAVTYVYFDRNRFEPPGAQRRTHSHPPLPLPDKLLIETINMPAAGNGRMIRMKIQPVSSPNVIPPPQHRPASLISRQQSFQSLGTDRATPEKADQISQIAPAYHTPVLRVDGIAFQDGSEGVAVVNGVPVTKGSSIEGARIDEVQKDRVLFSHDGKKIEVPLGKSNR